MIIFRLWEEPIIVATVVIVKVPRRGRTYVYAHDMLANDTGPRRSHISAVSAVSTTLSRRRGASCLMLPYSIKEIKKKHSWWDMIWIQC